MKIKWSVFLILLLSGMIIFGITFKAQHTGTTEHPWQKGLEYMNQRLSELTNGEYKLQIFPNGVLCERNWKIMLDQTQTNVTQIMVESSIPFATIVPELFIFNLPFSIDNQRHYYEFLAHLPPVVNKWFEKLSSKNLVVIGVWPRGFRQLLTTVGPIRKPEDLKGIKLRVPGLKLFVDTAKCLGLNPVPLSSGEIYTAIQTGAVQGEDNSVVNVYDFKTYEPAKYMTIWNYIPDIVLVVMNKSVFDSLPPEIQKAVKQAAAEAAGVVGYYEEQYYYEYMTKMIDYGIHFSFLSDRQKEAFKPLVKPVWEEMRKIVGNEDFEEYVKALEEARKRSQLVVSF